MRSTIISKTKIKSGLEYFNDWEKLPLFYTQYELDKDKKSAIREMRLSQDA